MKAHQCVIASTKPRTVGAEFEEGEMGGSLIRCRFSDCFDGTVVNSQQRSPCIIAGACPAEVDGTRNALIVHRTKALLQ